MTTDPDGRTMSLADLARDLSGLADLPGFEDWAAQQRALEERALKRKMKRAMLGGCECGEAVGDALCPWCDRDDLPEHLRAAGAMLRQRDRARGKIDVAKVAEALAGVAKVEPVRDCKTRPANRFERRRDAARRRRA